MTYLTIFILELCFLFFLSSQVTKSLSRLLHRFTKNLKLTIYLFAFCFLPGTLVHELAHFLAAIALLVPVGRIELIPAMRDGNLKLGSVEIAKVDPFRRAIIGFAPIFIGIISIFFILSFYDKNSLSWWQFFLTIYALFEIGNTMFSSKKDLEGSIVVLLMLIIITISLYVLNINIIYHLYNLYTNLGGELIVKKGVFMMGIPIGIDLLFLFITEGIFSRFLIRQ
ncbi:hypothetical protein LBMAG33_7640 [Candidatus Levyibacteriota bacterium]|nr:hypothetical protein [Candidatus Levybacteria bacterium]GDX62454.1 hypothetical protein LBMAG33_7640 [Candidatus Levybacteria bacterium]